MSKSATARLSKIAFWLAASLLAAILALMLAFIGANAWVMESTKDRIYNDAAMCSPNQVGIVFGTSYRLRNGEANPYYYARMNTASELMRMGRVSHLILSGDNRTLYYNEPISMWRTLISHHIPDSNLSLDYAGLSTLDTLYRARHIFGVRKATLITQAWHLPRALFIAKAEGIDATGCAANLPLTRQDHAMDMREWFARALAVFDVYIRHKTARIMGDPMPLDLSHDQAIG